MPLFLKYPAGKCAATPSAFPLEVGVCLLTFLGEGLFWRGFLAWLRFEAWLAFFVMLKAFPPFYSSHLSDLSQPWASLQMNCHVMPTPWRRSSLRNCGERHPQMKIIAMISCCVMSFFFFYPADPRGIT